MDVRFSVLILTFFLSHAKMRREERLAVLLNFVSSRDALYFPCAEEVVEVFLKRTEKDFQGNSPDINFANEK